MKEKYEKPKIESENFSIEMMTAISCTKPETEMEHLADTQYIKGVYPQCYPEEPCEFNVANQHS